MAYRSLGAQDAVATVALSFALFFLLGPLLMGLGAPGLALAQLVSFAGPALLVVRTRRGSAALLGFRRVPRWTVLPTVLVALTIWIWNVHWIAPLGVDWGAPDQGDALTELFALSSRPLWETLLIFAIVPAFCEELLHRGVILPSLRRHLGSSVALTISALLFGASHFSLPRLLPTALLGLFAGVVRLRTGSIWPAMTLHLLYNACLLTAAQQGWSPAPWVAWPAALVTLIALGWLWAGPQKHADLDS